MKKQILNLVGVMSISAILSGCVMPYNIEPYYNQSDRIVTVDSLSFNNARESKQFDPLIDGRIGTWIKSDKAYGIQDSKQCKNILYKTMKSGHRAYISNNVDDSLKKDYKKGVISNPKVTKINNLKFYDLVLKKSNKSMYSIGTDTRNSHGYDSVTFVKVDKNCFYTLKKHFTKKANKDEVQIENYNLIK